MDISIFGKGKMGTAIGDNFTTSGNAVNYILSDSDKSPLGEIVVLQFLIVRLKKLSTNMQTSLMVK